MTTPGVAEAEELIGALERWERAGGVWRVVRRSSQGATVSLMRCDAGEEVDRLASACPAWIAFLEVRPSSEA